jgi:hypothetical protein
LPTLRYFGGAPLEDINTKQELELTASSFNLGLECFAFVLQDHHIGPTHGIGYEISSPTAADPSTTAEAVDWHKTVPGLAAVEMMDTMLEACGLQI